MKKLFLILSFFLTSLLLFSFSLLSNKYTISSTDSTITWQGSKVGGTHTGMILIKEGTLLTENNTIVGGGVDIDMSSIFCTDIQNREDAKKLEGHLKSQDFFDVDKFPLASLKILEVKTVKGKNNYEVKANLTIKNITKEILFPAKIKTENNQIIADIKLTLDRTEYDVSYMSESITEKLKDKFIYNNFDLVIHLIAKK
jgi:polyisoprenoid-binding protein YceI